MTTATALKLSLEQRLLSSFDLRNLPKEGSGAQRHQWKRPGWAQPSTIQLPFLITWFWS